MSGKDVHDRTFINCMTDKRVAKQFFTQYLPESVLKLTHLDSLSLQKDTYIDKKLRKSVTDIVYSANINGELGYIYVLVDHKSSPDHLMPLQIMRYTLAIMDDHTKQHGTKELPLVYPLIFYHGEISPYPYAQSLGELFKKTQREKALSWLSQPIHIVDVGQIPDEELRQYAWSGLMSFVMKHRSTQDLVNRLEIMREPLYQIAIAGASDYYEILLEYLFQVSLPEQYDQILQVLHTMDKKIGDVTMTAFDVLMSRGMAKGLHEGIQKGFEQGIQQGMQKGIQQGMQKGIQQGMQKGIQQGMQKGIQHGMQKSAQQLAKRMLKKGISPETVMEITGLSADALAADIKNTQHQ